jgi:hypothetical protein
MQEQRRWDGPSGVGLVPLCAAVDKVGPHRPWRTYGQCATRRLRHQGLPGTLGLQLLVRHRQPDRGAHCEPTFQLMTCQKLMATELYRQLAVREDGFSIEPEVAAGLVLRGARIHEVAVPYRARRGEEGKKLTALDGLRVLRTLLRCRLRGG